MEKLSLSKICAGFLTKDYLPGAKAFFRSLLQFNKNFNLPFYIYNLDNEDYSCLLEIYSNIKFLTIDNSAYTEFNIHSPYRVWNYSVLSRIEIFKLNCDLLYFFDFDIIVLKNLDDFFNIQTDFAACRIEKDLYSYITNSEDYFDAGVMIIGKKYLNKQTFSELYELCGKQQWCGNEPLLNEYFKNKTQYIDKKFNCLTMEKLDTVDHVVMLQYVGHKKPWHKGSLKARYDDKVFSRYPNLIRIAHFQDIFNKYNYL